MSVLPVPVYPFGECVGKPDFHELCGDILGFLLDSVCPFDDLACKRAIHEHSHDSRSSDCSRHCPRKRRVFVAENYFEVSSIGA